MKKLSILLGCFVILAAATVAFASGGPGGYPSAPIQVTVSYSAGAATDFQARIVTMPAANEKYFGQPMVILNRAGAGGMTGWNWFVDRGSRDGMHMTVYNLPHLVAQALVQNPRFTVESFEPLANFGSDPAVLVVPIDSPHKTVQDYIAWAKANPKKMTINGAGLYVGHHIATLQLQTAAGIELTYVPEQGAADALASLYGKQVMSGFNNLSDAARAQDRLRILAVADLKRHEYLPNLPTFKELGVDIDDASVNYRGLAFPVGVPQPIIDWAAERALLMFQDKGVVDKMRESNSPMMIMDRKGAQALFANQKTTLTRLLVDKK